MTHRHAVLVVAALAVLALGVYLFVQVRAAPATVIAPPVATPTPGDDRPAPAAPAAPAASTAAGRAARPLPRADAGPAPPAAADPGADAPSLAPAGPPEDLQKLDAIMAEANKAYDRSDFDDARVIAQRVLAVDPKNVRMLRIMVSASCIEGDSVEAQKHYVLLPPFDRAAMRTRCDRYGVSFVEPP